MNKAVQIVLKGKLYRSGFRFYILQKAVELKIMGFVKYQDNKDIVVHAEGTQHQLKEFTEWCTKGTLSCKVASSEINEALVQNCTSFDIQK